MNKYDEKRSHQTEEPHKKSPQTEAEMADPEDADYLKIGEDAKK